MDTLPTTDAAATATEPTVEATAEVILPTFPTLETRPLQSAETRNTAHPAIVDVNLDAAKRAARWMSGVLVGTLESDWTTGMLLHLAYHLYHGEGSIPLPESLRGLPEMVNAFRREHSAAVQQVAEQREREREAVRRDPAYQLARQLTRNAGF